MKNIKGFSSAAIATAIIIILITIFMVQTLRIHTYENNSTEYFELEKVIKEQERLYEYGKNNSLIYCNSLIEKDIKTDFEFNESNCVVEFGGIKTKNCLFNAYSIEKNFFKNNLINSANLEQKLEELKLLMQSNGYKCNYRISNYGINECNSTKSFSLSCVLNEIEGYDSTKNQELNTYGGVQ